MCMLVFSVDAICYLTYTPSYVDNATIEAGTPSNIAEEMMMAKYWHLNYCYFFFQEAI